MTNEYYSSAEMTLEAQKQFVDPLLYKTIAWLTDEKLFNGAIDVEETNINRKCLSIACDITTECTSIFSPKHLGLAVQLHHDFGSRKLIEQLSFHGYCISYTELRRFLTSSAIFITDIQLENEKKVYIPPDLVRKDDGGTQVVSVADNWDHNEHTIDGKNTTHAMTSICIQPHSHPKIAYPRIPRKPSRSLDTDTDYGNTFVITSYFLNVGVLMV